jgi:hypothetical protein
MRSQTLKKAIKAIKTELSFLYSRMDFSGVVILQSSFTYQELSSIAFTSCPRFFLERRRRYTKPDDMPRTSSP